MRFDLPVALALLPLIGAVVWVGAFWARRRRIARAARWSEDLARAARRGGAGGPAALSLAAMLGMVALAGPRAGHETIVTARRSLSLVIAMDISRSMLAEDVQPSRLGRALREARRLVQDLAGDRLGLVAFAGSSHILSPLSVDASALELYFATLDPGVASHGGTALAAPLRQAAELLAAGPDLADRVLVLFTDGEAHDSLVGIVAAARALQEQGVQVILVAEGTTQPTRIPVHGDDGGLLEWQKHEGREIGTWRRDDVLAAVATAAGGVVIGAEVPDQAGAVRERVAAFKRAPLAATRTHRGRAWAWVPLLAAALVLVGQAAGRRTAALL
jgi:Ca-activated chloride channel family protein